MSRSSLKTRISLCIAALMLIIVGILSGIAYHEFCEALWRSMDTTLQVNLQQIKGLLLSNESDAAEREREIRYFLNPDKNFQKFEYKLWFENTGDKSVKILLVSDIGDTFAKAGIEAPDANNFALGDITQGDKTYRAVWARYSVDNDSALFLNVVLAISSKYAYHEVGEFVRVLVIVGAIIVWAAFGLTQQILRWGLQPIDKLAEQMGGIHRKNLQIVQKELPTPYRELLPFVNAWQAMLDRLAAAMQEQKRFTADAAHELKTPVALLKSTLQLAQSGKRSTQYYEKMTSNILEDVNRLSHLISQLLDLSHLESGRAAMEREVINLREILEDAVEYYKPLAAAKRFGWNGQLCDAVIYANRSYIYVLFGNIIDNAIKYAPSDTTIAVSMAARDGIVSVTVHDEGGNISEQECRLLFNRFYRVTQSRDCDSGGSGLGLAIAQEIAHLHGGGIRVASSRAEGTSFTVTLPLYDLAKQH